MTIAQLSAITIFTIMFAAIISGRIHRYIPAMLGALLTIGIVFLLICKDTGMVVAVLNLAQVGEAAFWWPGAAHIESEGVNWQTLIFI